MLVPSEYNCEEPPPMHPGRAGLVQDSGIRLLNRLCIGRTSRPHAPQQPDAAERNEWQSKSSWSPPPLRRWHVYKARRVGLLQSLTNQLLRYLG